MYSFINKMWTQFFERWKLTENNCIFCRTWWRRLLPGPRSQISTCVTFVERSTRCRAFFPHPLGIFPLFNISTSYFFTVQTDSKGWKFHQYYCLPIFVSLALLRIRDPVPFWPLDPGSGIGFFRIPAPIPSPYFWELNENFLGTKFYNSL